jgi:hypothetical protein
MINMVPTIMLLHLHSRISGLIIPEAYVSPIYLAKLKNDPLLASLKTPVVAEVTTL